MDTEEGWRGAGRDYSPFISLVAKHAEWELLHMRFLCQYTSEASLIVRTRVTKMALLASRNP